MEVGLIRHLTGKFSPQNGGWRAALGRELIFNQFAYDYLVGACACLVVCVVLNSGYIDKKFKSLPFLDNAYAVSILIADKKVPV